MKSILVTSLVLSASLAYAQSTTTTVDSTSGTNTTGTTTTGTTTTGTSTTRTAPIGTATTSSSTTSTTVPTQAVPSDPDAPRSTLFRSGMLFVGGRVNIGLNNGTQGLDTAGSRLSDVNGLTFGFAPRVGIYLSNRFAVGAYGAYDQSTSTFKQNGVDFERTSSSFGAGAFLRYSVGLANNAYDGTHTLGWFTDLALDYKNGTLKRTGLKDSPNSEFGVGLAPGIIWFPTPRVGLEAGLGNFVRYSVEDLDLVGGTNSDPDGGDVTVGIRAKGSRLELLNFNTMGLKIGFHYYFNAGR